MKVVLIVGLPGSGKTHTAVNEYVPRGFVLVDDPFSLEEVDEAVQTGRDLVITAPHLVWPENRAFAERLFTDAGYTVEWVFFENDPVKAEANIRRRQDDRGPIDVRLFSLGYSIPEGVLPRPIWAP